MDSFSDYEEFKSVAFSECDDCGESNQLNTLGYCKPCNAAADAFSKAASDAISRGHSPFKAGMIAQAQPMRRK